MTTMYFNQEMMLDWMQQGMMLQQPVLLPLGRNGRVLVPIGAMQQLPAQPLFPVMNKGANAHIHGEGPPQMRKLFIGGLSHETTDEHMRLYFSKWGPVIDSIVIREPNTKQSRGFGFVTFATLAAVENAMADRPHYIGGKIVDSKRAIPREQMMSLMQSPFVDYDIPYGCKLTITGIHCDFHTVETLRLYFEKFGTLDQVEILGKPRGVGFVVFERREDADRCLAFKGGRHLINEKRIDVRPAPPSHYRQYWKKRSNQQMMQPQPLFQLVDRFGGMSMQPHPLLAYMGPSYGYSEEESSYGCTTEDESKAYEESEQESSSSGSEDRVRKNSA
ncbi:hypothetical protein PMAYCL1PPCAC_30422 [Pristionchus mayeri]|uniref:RRM domain-containing protein n=1 Tax=Pristionchus mayeri TaxID=1317129 RepID=A0AAN5DCV0_9BILA|nr:hypothetical protein PMAYCL1PPCAC_30422 [Pristionchus mayeri]